MRLDVIIVPFVLNLDTLLGNLIVKPVRWFGSIHSFLQKIA